MSEETYKCSECKGTFDKAWSDKDAMEEAERNGFVHGKLVIVCHDCYNKIVRFIKVREN